MSGTAGFYPGRAPIEAYGNGGFRFAGMSHRGSLLLLPGGIRAWHATDASRLEPEDFAAAFAEAAEFLFLLLGTGERQVFPSRPLRAAFEVRGLGLEAMATGAACRTYNVLLAEQRPVAAALIAVA